ncbi:helix-turn-helix domain-containing protein [Streptomyces sp. NPDC058612]|uniref:helix-turn-helix domain-containing protein n=1 Tax=Streptomyces sp. NPDC058612 TaxID=3346555 RepID=UPI00364E843A
MPFQGGVGVRDNRGPDTAPDPARRRGDEGTWGVGMDEPRAAGPAAALRTAVSGFTAYGGTQREIAVAVHVSPAALSRYVSGERIPPPTTSSSRWTRSSPTAAVRWRPACGSDWRSCADGHMRPAARRRSSWPT